MSYINMKLFYFGQNYFDYLLDDQQVILLKYLLKTFLN